MIVLYLFVPLFAFANVVGVTRYHTGSVKECLGSEVWNELKLMDHREAFVTRNKSPHIRLSLGEFIGDVNFFIIT